MSLCVYHMVRLTYNGQNEIYLYCINITFQEISIEHELSIVKCTKLQMNKSVWFQHPAFITQQADVMCIITLEACYWTVCACGFAPCVVMLTPL